VSRLHRLTFFGCCLVVVLAASYPRATIAETALDVQSWCRRVVTAPTTSGGKIQIPPDANSQACWSAFMAVQELSSLVERSDGPNLMGFCTPKEGTRWQLVQVFERYADKHPEQLHLTFGEVAIGALFEAFPCRKN
jgi:hypothetical protein